MYPAAFDYSAPTTLDDALALLAAHGDDAKLLAGGHSLLPLMKLRFAQPGHLVDLRLIPSLTGISRTDDAIRIGAMTTYADIAASAEIQRTLPILSDAANRIGDPQVRNRGTIGGSLAHADPAADLPAVMIATNAQMIAVGRTGTRTISADEFFVGMLATALARDEVLTEIRISIPGIRSGGAYAKHAHPASRFAMVGVAAVVSLDESGLVSNARIGVTGVGPHAVRASRAEASLIGHAASADVVRAAATVLGEDVDPREDLLGDAVYKRNLARVYAERAITAAVARATV